MAAGFFPYTDYTRYMIKSGEEIIKKHIPRVCFQKHKFERKAKKYANLEKNQKENRESMSNITHEVSHMKRII